MYYVNITEDKALKALGNRLEAWRLKRNETQESLASRIGISTLTYSKMANGVSTVRIGYWVRALNLLTSLAELDELLKEKESFFSERDKNRVNPQKRVKRRKI